MVVPMKMRFCKFSDVFRLEIARDAIINNLPHAGFKEDYLVLHCLLRLWMPKVVVEIGTNEGRGTKIIKNAVGMEAQVYTLDLPPDIGPKVATEYTPGRVGSLCDLPFVQLWGDSRTYDFKSIGGIEAFYIDGEHTYNHVHTESLSAIRTNAKLIIYHDAEYWEIFKGIADAFYYATRNYHLCRVYDTRIMLALRKDVPWMF